MGHPRVEMIGKTFGRLTILEVCGKSSNGGLRFKCRCSCGNYHEADGGDIRRGHIRSCGCLASISIRNSNTRHRGSCDRLYEIWHSMKQRCNNPNHPSYKDYGERGISYTPEWEDYAVFRDFMLSIGYDPNAPKGQCTIERIDVNGNYCPENCRIADMGEQARNRRNNRLLTYKGVTKPLISWAREFDIFEETLRHRLNKGMSIEEALETPVDKSKSHSRNKWQN